MGFCGLDHWSQSDQASDFRWEIEKAVGRVFTKEMKTEANEWNTPGIVNIMLVVEEFPQILQFMSEDTLDFIYEKVRSFNWLEWNEPFHKDLKRLVKSFLAAVKKVE